MCSPFPHSYQWKCSSCSRRWWTWELPASVCLVAWCFFFFFLFIDKFWDQKQNERQSEWTNRLTVWSSRKSEVEEDDAAADDDDGGGDRFECILNRMTKSCTGGRYCKRSRSRHLLGVTSTQGMWAWASVCLRECTCDFRRRGKKKVKDLWNMYRWVVCVCVCVCVFCMACLYVHPTAEPKLN